MKRLCPRLVSLYGTAITIAFFVMGLSLYAVAAPAPEGIRELSTQSANVRGWIDVALDPELVPWDDSAGMVGRRARHGSRQTMLYAAGLILRNHPEDLERAHRAIRAVLKLQYDAPGMAWHGTYKTDDRQPDQPKPTLLEKGYDENWREFISTAQIVLLEGCPSRLESALRDELLAALRRACEGAHARTVSWHYTNIALMSAYLLAWGGRQFDDPAWSQHGAKLAREIHTEFCRTQAFQEYNSPTYSGTDLYALALWRALPVFPEMATMAREMEAGLWRDLARHYHADFRSLCGPFDRSYGMDMRTYLAKISICIALALDLPAALPDARTVEHHGFEMGFAPLMAALGMTMPDDAAPYFHEFQSPRRFEQMIENGEHPRTAQSWLERNFMVGAEQTSGEGYQSKQAHPFTLHWKISNSEIGWIRMLRDTPMEPRIVDDTITFTQMRKVPRNFAFEVFSPGATVQSFQATRWDLPGMPLAVETNLSPPEITLKDGRFTVRYSLAGTESLKACLKFRILTSATSLRNPAVLNPETFRHYVTTFNQNDHESVVNYIPNAGAWDWIVKNVPLLDCPDKDIEEVYYFRWWTYRKHIKETPDGFVVTEFLPQVEWSKKHNTINCPVGHHLYEGRWIHDPKFLDDYMRFYFGKGGDPGGVSKCYSNWIADGIYARYLANADRSFITGLLDELVNNYEAWKRDGNPGDAFQKGRRLDNGLYWQIDSWEGQEFSIGGTGSRPPINSYMYGDAMAIARIAELAGRKELAGQYRAEAEQLRKLIQDQLWDPDGKFFNVMRHENAPTNQYLNAAAENCEPGQRVKVREIFGYVPWYFNLPEDGRGYEEAWRQLTDPQGFLAPFGPTVAERRHPNFKINDSGCQWCGASWPFSTAQTLTALANLLNNYHQNAIGNKEYFDALKTYTKSHRRKLPDGVVVPWIDESLNPDTGVWIMNGDCGANYNHSTYCDLIISGLIGLRPWADDTIEVNPLLPDGVWDYFCLDNVRYHDRTITVIYDKTGQRYGKGKGLQVLADGQRVADCDSLQRLTGSLSR